MTNIELVKTSLGQNQGGHGLDIDKFLPIIDHCVRYGPETRLSWNDGEYIEVNAATPQSSTLVQEQSDSGFQTLNDANPNLEGVVIQTRASIGAPRGYSYPNGVVTFNVPGLSNGTSVEVRLILADGVLIDTVWALKAEDTWSDSAAASITNQEIVLTLTDGGAGDSDGEANGTIVAAIGPASTLPSVPPVKLNVVQKGPSNLELSWPTANPNVQLEFSDDLSEDSWRLIYLTSDDDTNEYLIPYILPGDDTVRSGFYRLRYIED